MSKVSSLVAIHRCLPWDEKLGQFDADLYYAMVDLVEAVVVGCNTKESCPYGCAYGVDSQE